jgi:hypothetical protein
MCMIPNELEAYAFASPGRRVFRRGHDLHWETEGGHLLGTLRDHRVHNSDQRPGTVSDSNDNSGTC